MRENGITHVASAPTGFRQLAAAGVEAFGGDGRAPASLRAATSGGEPLNAEVIRWWQENVGVTIHDSYGLTELGMLICNLRGPGALEPAPGSMGVELPGFAIRLLDDEGNEVRGEGEGRIAVLDHDFLLSRTYWGREAEWDARVEDGWWVTEDVARRDAQGRYWYLSRADDVIVTAGYNVGPFEVETVLMEHPLVADVAVVGVPDERKGQVIEAHIVLAAGGATAGGATPAEGATPATPELTAELKKWVGERVGWHAAPRHVTVHHELPRTESGKVKRRELRAK
jgi:acetyl-CoA synthetase